MSGLFEPYLKAQFNWKFVIYVLKKYNSAIGASKYTKYTNIVKKNYNQCTLFLPDQINEGKKCCEK